MAELMSPSLPKNCVLFAGRECSKKLAREFIIKCDVIIILIISLLKKDIRGEDYDFWLKR